MAGHIQGGRHVSAQGQPFLRIHDNHTNTATITPRIVTASIITVVQEVSPTLSREFTARPVYFQGRKHQQLLHAAVLTPWPSCQCLLHRAKPNRLCACVYMRVHGLLHACTLPGCASSSGDASANFGLACPCLCPVAGACISATLCLREHVQGRHAARSNTRSTALALAFALAGSLAHVVTVVALLTWCAVVIVACHACGNQHGMVRF